MPITPTIVDLCSLAQAKDWLGLKQDNTDDDSVIQSVITSFSQWVLNITGALSYNSVQNYVDIYDGNGSFRMFLKNRPIVTVSSVIIGAYSVPPSTSTTSSGYFIEQTGRSIAFRSSGQSLTPAFSIFPYLFTPGVGNIQITYSAGYTRVPTDLQEACFKAVAITYKRKDYIDLISKALSSGAGVSGTISYRGWNLPPEIKDVINYYSRYARP